MMSVCLFVCVCNIYIWIQLENIFKFITHTCTILNYNAIVDVHQPLSRSFTLSHSPIFHVMFITKFRKVYGVVTHRSLTT